MQHSMNYVSMLPNHSGSDLPSHDGSETVNHYKRNTSGSFGGNISPKKPARCFSLSRLCFYFLLFRRFENLIYQTVIHSTLSVEIIIPVGIALDNFQRLTGGVGKDSV